MNVCMWVCIFVSFPLQFNCVFGCVQKKSIGNIKKYLFLKVNDFKRKGMTLKRKKIWVNKRCISKSLTGKITVFTFELYVVVVKNYGTNGEFCL